jgi:hypothetical protein
MAILFHQIEQLLTALLAQHRAQGITQDMDIGTQALVLWRKADVFAVH